MEGLDTLVALAACGAGFWIGYRFRGYLAGKKELARVSSGGAPGQAP